MDELEKQKSANAWLRKCVATRDAQIDELVGERDATLEREQALEAHVARIKAEEKRAYSGGLSMPGLLHEIIHQSPADSLTRRDLIKQAEALEGEAGKFKRDAGDADSVNDCLRYKRVVRCLLESARDLRQRANN